MRVAAPFPNSAVPDPAPRWAFGVEPLDAALGGGMAFGRVHEFYAAEPFDAGALVGFGAVVAGGMAAGQRTGEGGAERSILWLRLRRSVGQNGVIQGWGLNELGMSPHAMIFAVLPDGLALLRAAVDGLRCSALGAVVVESWGPLRELDLTASRRLALAAERSGVPLVLLQADAAPVPSAAQTRWQVAAAPSRALPADAPGSPAFAVELLRQKAGPGGLSWHLEWDRDQGKFREAALPGAVVSVPVRRSAATGGTDGPGPGEYRAA